MITGDYDQLNELVGRHVCAEDNGRLNVAWHKEQSCYYIKCAICGECKGMSEVPSLTQAHKQGLLTEGPVQDNVKKSVQKRAQSLPQSPQAETFQGIPATDLGTGDLIPQQVLQALVSYAKTYGLDPARGHVCLMYGLPYITIDGYFYHAYKEKIALAINVRPLDESERKVYQVNEGDHAWVCNIVRGNDFTKFTGIGIVTKAEMEEESKKKPGHLRSPIVAAHPWQLAQKRAEHQALRRAFPIGESQEEVTNGQGRE